MSRKCKRKIVDRVERPDGKNEIVGALIRLPSIFDEKSSAGLGRKQRTWIANLNLGGKSL